MGAKSEKNITEVFINLFITSKGKAGREKKVSISKKPQKVKAKKGTESSGVSRILKGAEKEKKERMGMVPKKAKKDTQKERKTTSFLGCSRSESKI